MVHGQIRWRKVQLPWTCVRLSSTILSFSKDRADRQHQRPSQHVFHHSPFVSFLFIFCLLISLSSSSFFIFSSVTFCYFLVASFFINSSDQWWCWVQILPGLDGDDQDIDVDNDVRPQTGTCVRKEYRRLTIDEIRAFHAALNTMKNNGEYDVFTRYHRPASSPGAHFGPAFFCWHRYYLIMYVFLARDAKITQLSAVSRSHYYNSA